MLDTVNFQLYRLVIEYETGEKLRVTLNAVDAGWETDRQLYISR